MKRRIFSSIHALLLDASGNALPLMAAALIPLLALVGGSIDMGRSYLAQSRLQQACDAGVLAARKRIGTAPAGGAGIPADAVTFGTMFFSANFQDKAFGTKNRTFNLTLQNDYTLSGEATVDVPTTIMQVFGQKNVAVKVNCAAQVGMRNTDVVMVLDVTGSMTETNPGDSKSKIELMKDSILAFHSQLTASATQGTRLRFGFVPYSTNVNAGGVLTDDWVAKTWNYQSRKQVGTGTTVGTVSFWAVGNPIGGTANRTTDSTYAATKDKGKYVCAAPPPGSPSLSGVMNGTTTEPFPGPPTGILTRVNYTYTYNGTDYSVSLAGSTCTVTKTVYSNWKVSYDWVTQPAYTAGSKWLYSSLPYDVSNWRTETEGCMEEPDTEDISRDDLNQGKVDLKKAHDLDLDFIPTSASPNTQWRPIYPANVYGRERKWDGSGSFNASPISTTDEFVTPKYLGTASCPNAVSKLASMTSSQVGSYLNQLKVGGSTYHDIGLLWGARLIAPNGLFAAENADVSPNQPTMRDIVMLTDGQTSTLDLSYSAYGFEPVDQRRWKPSDPDSLTAIVEARFAFICQEAKKRNIQIWFIAFGTELNPLMQQCAGADHAFQAKNGTELAAAFATISNRVTDLRIVK